MRKLDDIALCNDSKEEKVLEELKKLWKENKLSKRIKVKFMYSDCEIGTEDPIIFSLWFAGKLAEKYLSWCKQDLLAKKKNWPLSASLLLIRAGTPRRGSATPTPTATVHLTTKPRRTRFGA